MNRELLGMIPHRPFLDLAVAYYIRVDEMIAGDKGMSFALVRNSYMELWGQNEESLYRTAFENMRLEGEPLFEDMGTLLKCIVPEGITLLEDKEPPIPDMYVLSNQRRSFGAAELLDGNTLRGIGNRLEDDYIVLPSSVHESIILPLNNAPAYPELAGMVREVNREQVDIQDRLSDHVYRYGRKEDKLEIVA